jgi:RNA polymerase sigma-70 factor (TIGR02960 family)
MSGSSTSSAALERELLELAGGGDEGAFRRLVEPYRGELQAHCYRMLGSLHDAEDALQEALLGAWRGLARFEGRSSLRAWLYRIATNACLRLIERRPRRVLPVELGSPTDPRDELGEPRVESVWVEPYPDERLGLEEDPASPEARYEQRESVELAFVAALQHLPGTQRAVLILREALGFSAREVAESLDTTVASVNSALQRARTAVAERLPEQSQQAALRSLGDDGVRDLVEAFVAAFEDGDVDAVLDMLAEDATFTMPPLPAWFRGHDAIRVFLAERAFEFSWRFVPLRASGQLAFAAYQSDPEREGHRLGALNVVTLRDGRVQELNAFLDPEVHRRFGLPYELR